MAIFIESGILLSGYLEQKNIIIQKVKLKCRFFDLKEYMRIPMVSNWKTDRRLDKNKAYIWLVEACVTSNLANVSKIYILTEIRLVDCDGT